MKPLSLDGFERKFEADGDPWRTYSDHDEAMKRQAIVHALGPARCGRVLELGAGNGSNSIALARRALRLDATEATKAGTRLVARALTHPTRARAVRLSVPARFPSARYDAIIIAELLYYLDARQMVATARDVAAAMADGGRLILAHHHVDYPDFAQHAAPIHRRFLAASGRRWRIRSVRMTGRWRVDACRPV